MLLAGIELERDADGRDGEPGLQSEIKWSDAFQYLFDSPIVSYSVLNDNVQVIARSVQIVQLYKWSEGAVNACFGGPR